MDNKVLIITVHGIRTDLEDPKVWQLDFGRWLNTNYPEQQIAGQLKYLPFSYGVLGPVGSFIINVFSWVGLAKLVNVFAVSQFVKFLRQAQTAYPDYKIHVVSHSFGTWVTHEALRNNSDLNVEGYHLFGGVISAHITKNSLDEMLMVRQIEKCLVWCSHNDVVVRYLAVPPFGHIGYWGILTNDKEDRIHPKWQPYAHLTLYNRETRFGHSDYFVPGTFSMIMEDILQ